MPTPPLPSRDDDEHGAHGEGEAVTLWKEFGYRPFLDGWNEDPAHKGGEDSVEGRWMPLDTYNALLARANTATVAADLMRDRAEKAERFLSMLFESHWDGTIGRPPTWRLRGDFRHILAGMRGETLAAAIEAHRSRLDDALGEGGA